MKYIVSVSGGKDSTTLALYALARYSKKDLVFVTADTGAEFPETYEYLSYLEKKLGIKIHRVKSELWDFWSYCRHRQKFPDARNRFCTSKLKQAPLAKWITQQGFDRYNDIMLTGERWEESKRRSIYTRHYYNQSLRIAGCRPILDLTTKEVFAAIRQAGLVPHPIYDHWSRLGCYCCIFNTVDEWVTLAQHFPELFEKVCKLEEELNYTIRRGENLRQLVNRKTR